MVALKNHENQTE